MQIDCKCKHTKSQATKIHLSFWFPFAFHPGSVAQVSFFSHKCTRQLRQMPNNRRCFLLWHENAAVASCTCGPQDQLNLLLAEVENVRPPPSLPPFNCEFVLLRFYQRNHLRINFSEPRFYRIFKHGDTLSPESQASKQRHSHVPYSIL